VKRCVLRVGVLGALCIVAYGSDFPVAASNGITYSLTGLLATLTGNSLTLTANAPMTFPNYSGQVPTGRTITGATLDLDLLIGSLNMELLNSQPQNPYFIPGFAGNFGNVSITITSGSVTRTVNGTSITAYDLFANGFGAQIAAGAPLIITFNVKDQVSAVTTYAPAPVIVGLGAGPALPPAGNEVLQFQDTRTLVLKNGVLTLYTSPQTVEPPIDVPEPITAGLLGCGLAVLGYVRLRQKRRWKERPNDSVPSVNP
jgi:hypothetical protein